jgi:alkylhydroperoxidase family enzyme
LGDRELVASVLAGVHGAPISDKDRALYRFVRKMVHDSLSIGPDDVETAHAAGWTDEALYDAISVVALFQFYNAWIDASGVRDMPALAYEMSGKRLSTQGYVMKSEHT